VRIVGNGIAIAGVLLAALCLYGAITWPAIDVGAIVRVVFFVTALLQGVPMLGFRFSERPPGLVGWIVWLTTSLVILVLGSQVGMWIVERWRS